MSTLQTRLLIRSLLWLFYLFIYLVLEYNANSLIPQLPDPTPIILCLSRLPMKPGHPTEISV